MKARCHALPGRAADPQHSAAAPLRVAVLLETNLPDELAKQRAHAQSTVDQTPIFVLFFVFLFLLTAASRAALAYTPLYNILYCVVRPFTSGSDRTQNAASEGRQASG